MSDPVTFAPSFHEEMERRAREAQNKFTQDWVKTLRVDWDEVDDAEVPDIIQDLVADEEVTLLGGHGGVGKSFLALQMACAVATGMPVLGKSTDLLRIGEPKRVLYYSAEDGKKRLIRRMQRIITAFDVYNTRWLRENLLIIDASDLEPLFGELDVRQRTFSKPLGAKVDFYRLQKIIEKHDSRLVIIDGASDTFDGNEISRRDVRSFIKLLRKVHPHQKAAVLLTVHIDRSSARGHTSNDDGYSGSSQWHNSCRRRLYLQLKKEKDEDGAELGETMMLRVMKNQDGAPISDMELERHDGVWYLLGSKPDDVEFWGELAPPAPKVDHSGTLLKLIDEYYQRGQWISTSLAPQAKTGVYDTLKGDADFPKGLNRKKTETIVRQLIRDSLIVEETYRRPQGGTAARWKVMTTARESA